MKKNFVSHTVMDHASIVKFIEWNWLHDNRLKGYREQNDPRAYRDTVVNNIGGLINPDAAGVQVPAGQH